MHPKNHTKYFDSCGFRLTSRRSAYILAVCADRETSDLGRSLCGEYDTLEEVWNAWQIATIRALQYEACDQWIDGLIQEGRIDDHRRVIEALKSAPRLPRDLQDEMDIMLMGIPHLPTNWHQTAKRLLTQRYAP
ncbi:hypothetical protein [Stenotrophomonas rhizophila]|jgi:hypothetical protein|uniref:hypothetical protein n=1 Tax=Stenotrophomonas rhizophila TaxID=216778 RepID=UPI0028B0CA7C|nr:hypothetical protein [Stenotrophomonas rhizophila]